MGYIQFLNLIQIFLWLNSSLVCVALILRQSFLNYLLFFLLHFSLLVNIGNSQSLNTVCLTSVKFFCRSIIIYIGLQMVCFYLLLLIMMRMMMIINIILNQKLVVKYVIYQMNNFQLTYNWKNIKLLLLAGSSFSRSACICLCKTLLLINTNH